MIIMCRVVKHNQGIQGNHANQGSDNWKVLNFRTMIKGLEDGHDR